MNSYGRGIYFYHDSSESWKAGKQSGIIKITCVSLLQELQEKEYLGAFISLGIYSIMHDYLK